MESFIWLRNWCSTLPALLSAYINSVSTVKLPRRNLDFHKRASVQVSVKDKMSLWEMKDKNIHLRSPKIQCSSAQSWENAVAACFFDYILDVFIYHARRTGILNSAMQGHCWQWIDANGSTAIRQIERFKVVLVWVECVTK